MNKVIIDKYEFTDDNSGNGKIIDGSYYIQNSLAQDELDVDTLRIKVRYPLTGDADTSITTLPYAAKCEYYQDGKFFGKYYLEKATRISKYEYEISFQSAIGLLDDSQHYGGIYTNDLFEKVIKSIIGDKIIYEFDPVFDGVRISGWLPIASRRENLKQALFAVGAVIKNTPQGDPYITALSKDIVPTHINPDRIYNGGNIDYSQSMNAVEITEHSYGLSDTKTELFKGDLTGSSFTTPMGNIVNNAALITFNSPCYAVSFKGTELLNGEKNCNYAVVSSGQGIVIEGYVYDDYTNIGHYTKSTNLEKPRTAKVTDATLVSGYNSKSVAERLLAYYKHQDVLNSSIISQGEKPTDSVLITSPFGDASNGFIKSIDGNLGSQITKADLEIALDFNPPSPYGTKEVMRIEIETLPDKVNYGTGDYFNPSGMIVRAYYDDESSDIVYNYTWLPDIPLKENDTYVTIAYTEAGKTVTANINITVKTLLRRIGIIQPPTKTKYQIGQTFNPDGMIVRAYYSDGSFIDLISGQYTWEPNRPLEMSDGAIIITYSEDGITVSTQQDIIIGEQSPLALIIVSKKPNKMDYEIGEFFNPEGMQITAIYEDGSNEVVNGYNYTQDGAFDKGKDIVTITYTIGGRSKTTTLKVVVYYLQSIYVSNPPLYTEYYEGDTFNPLQMKITAVMSNGNEIELQDNEYKYTSDKLVLDDKAVIISYTRKNITETTSQPITVKYFPYPYNKSVMITRGYNKPIKDMLPGITHKNIKVLAIGSGEYSSHYAGEDTYPNAGKVFDRNTKKLHYIFNDSNMGIHFKMPNELEAGMVYTPTMVGESIPTNSLRGNNGGQQGLVKTQEILLKDIAQEANSSISLADSTQSGISIFNTEDYYNGNIEVSSTDGTRPINGLVDDITGNIYCKHGDKGKDGAASGGSGAFSLNVTSDQVIKDFKNSKMANDDGYLWDISKSKFPPAGKGGDYGDYKGTNGNNYAALIPLPYEATKKNGIVTYPIQFYAQNRPSDFRNFQRFEEGIKQDGWYDSFLEEKPYQTKISFVSTQENMYYGDFYIPYTLRSGNTPQDVLDKTQYIKVTGGGFPKLRDSLFTIDIGEGSIPVSDYYYIKTLYQNDGSKTYRWMDITLNDDGQSLIEAMDGGHSHFEINMPRYKTRTKEYEESNGGAVSNYGGNMSADHSIIFIQLPNARNFSPEESSAIAAIAGKDKPVCALLEADKEYYLRRDDVVNDVKGWDIGNRNWAAWRGKTVNSLVTGKNVDNKIVEYCDQTFVKYDFNIENYVNAVYLNGIATYNMKYDYPDYHTYLYLYLGPSGGGGASSTGKAIEGSPGYAPDIGGYSVNLAIPSIGSGASGPNAQGGHGSYARGCRVLVAGRPDQAKFEADKIYGYNHKIDLNAGGIPGPGGILIYYS